MRLPGQHYSSPEVSRAESVAGFLTLASSAHRNDLEVRAYLREILQQFLDGEMNYESMLLWNLAATHPECIGEHRRDERWQNERAKCRAGKRLLAARTKAS